MNTQKVSITGHTWFPVACIDRVVTGMSHLLNKVRMKKKFSCFCILFLVGCSTPKTYITNIKPSPADIPQNKVFYFNQGTKITWDKLLSLAYSSPFQVDGINMNAFQVKLRLEGNPDAYINCGTKRVVTESQVTTIINSASQYSYEAYRHIHLDTYKITNRFTGIANVVVTGDNVSSKAMTQFELQLHTIQSTTSTQGRQHSPTIERTLKLRSNEEVLSPIFGTTCRSTGKFEESFLNLISMIQK